MRGISDLNHITEGNCWIRIVDSWAHVNEVELHVHSFTSWPVEDRSWDAEALVTMFTTIVIAAPGFLRQTSWRSIPHGQISSRQIADWMQSTSIVQTGLPEVMRIIHQSLFFHSFIFSFSCYVPIYGLSHHPYLPHPSIRFGWLIPLILTPHISGFCILSSK